MHMMKMKTVLSLHTSLTALLYSCVLNSSNTMMHVDGMKTHSTRATERRTTTSFNASFFADYSFREIWIATNMGEIITCNDLQER